MEWKYPSDTAYVVSIVDQVSLGEGSLKMSGMFSSGWGFMKIVPRIDDPFEVPKLKIILLHIEKRTAKNLRCS